MLKICAVEGLGGCFWQFLWGMTKKGRDGASPHMGYGQIWRVQNGSFSYLRFIFVFFFIELRFIFVVYYQYFKSIFQRAEPQSKHLLLAGRPSLNSKVKTLSHLFLVPHLRGWNCHYHRLSHRAPKEKGFPTVQITDVNFFGTWGFSRRNCLVHYLKHKYPF